jgi:hypothetical protein
LIAPYDTTNDDAFVVEDGAGEEAQGQTLMIAPTALAPSVRELIARMATA